MWDGSYDTGVRCRLVWSGYGGLAGWEWWLGFEEFDGSIEERFGALGWGEVAAAFNDFIDGVRDGAVESSTN